MVSIHTNLSSLIAQGSLTKSTNTLNRAIEQMSTGYKINHASDNAANYSIKTNMDTKIGAYQVAEDNAMMGLDMLQTAESSLNQISDKLSRLRALAVTAQNGTYGAQSLSALNSEAGALTQEINRIFSTATYNGKKLLDAYHTEIPEDVGCQVDLTPRYNGFIQDPVDYTEADIALMNKMSEVDKDNDTISSGQYSISTAEDLAKLATMTNDGRVTGGEFVLAEDIDLAPYLNGASWTPIGNSTNAFTATFNGNGHVVENLYINITQNYQGLFGYISGNAGAGLIENVGIKDANITETGYYAGTLAGCAEYRSSWGAGGGINNCYTTGTVSSSSNYIGGLIGFVAQCKVQNSYSSCNVYGYKIVGGLIGNPDGAGQGVEKCFATGNVSGSAAVGGLCGNISAVIKNCYASGDVYANESAGGLIGSGSSSYAIEKSHSTGKVEGKLNTGGLVGWRGNGGRTINSYASGSVIGEKCVGAVFGCLELTRGETQEFINVHGYGDIIGTEAVGSFVGAIVVKKDGTLYGGVNISDCFATIQNLSIVGDVYELNGSTYSSLSSYDLSSWESGISSIYIPPDETTLQVGIKSTDSSSLVFNATVEYGAFDVLQGLNLQDASAISTIDTLMKQVSDKQTELGATQNRLMSVLEEINVQYENLVSSRSTIQDADMSEVSATYIQQQILQQASATLMATANQTPAIALQLI